MPGSAPLQLRPARAHCSCRRPSADRSATPAIAEPADFYDAPTGVCVDLSRFAVETLRHIDPQLQPRYLMIEFEPVTLRATRCGCTGLPRSGATGSSYLFADSEAPGPHRRALRHGPGLR